MKSQIISMDFIMTFVVYIFALSVFFFALKNSVSYEARDLDVQSELLFNRLDQIYDENYDFLDGAKINKTKLDNFLNSKYGDERTLYDFVFRDLESSYFKKMDYCVFIEDKNSRIIKNFAAYINENSIYFVNLDNSDDCGSNKDKTYTSYPKCNLKESILLSKPVLYGNTIYKLNVLICAE